MKIQGIIEKKEITEDTEWTRGVFFIDGTRYSTFDKKIIDNCSKGDYVEFEAVQKEKDGRTFNNLTSMKLLDSKPEVVKPGLVIKEPGDATRWLNKNGNGYIKDPVGLAIEVYCGMDVKNMIKAIDLVKQAKEAFE